MPRIIELRFLTPVTKYFGLDAPEFAGVDGPCFDAHQVDFDVAMRRNTAYVRDEKLAVNRLNCRELY